MTLEYRSRDYRQSPKRRHVLDVHQIRFWVKRLHQTIGQWALVRYHTKPYPDFVEDVHEGELYVACVDVVGKGFSKSFIWPNTYRGVCWYEYDNRLAVIPKPVLTEGQANNH